MQAGRTQDARFLAGLFGVACISCGPKTDTVGEAQDPPANGSDSSSGSSSEGDSSSGDGVAFVGPSVDAGARFPCSLWRQNCLAGEKCMPWVNDGGGHWNATHCIAVDPQPDAVGKPCTFVGSVWDGVDSCARGAMCRPTHWGANAGTCEAFCGGDEANPICDDPDMHCDGGRDVALCTLGCCPLEQLCGEGRACYPAGTNAFECAPDVSAEEGSFGDPCEFFNVCDPGLFCASANVFADCQGAGCCSTFCDVEDPDASANCPEAWNGQACIPWFMDRHAPPGEENIGACALPW